MISKSAAAAVLVCAFAAALYLAAGWRIALARVPYWWELECANTDVDLRAGRPDPDTDSRANSGGNQYFWRERLSRQANEYDRVRGKAMANIRWSCWIMAGLWPVLWPASVLNQSMVCRITACDPARVRKQDDRIAELEKELDLR